jgi:transcriptional regulator with XRE-family HTH domain
MTQQALAAACGTTFKQIHKYESATNALLASRLWPIAEALDVPISYFFEGLEPPPSLANQVRESTA